MHSRYLAGLAAALLIAATCHTEAQAAGAHTGVCKPAAAAALTGKNRISNRRAKRLTGATMVRQIRPGQGVTKDYRRERVTIETNPETGKIVHASCG